ncbi:hypothetical protein I546_6096 [Mycobacterium kansasii 732]|nr:hypothetical protein I546_6096 [Mycobacterium kansasii 732]
MPHLAGTAVVVGDGSRDFRDFATARHRARSAVGPAGPALIDRPAHFWSDLFGFSGARWRRACTLRRRGAA